MTVTELLRMHLLRGVHTPAAELTELRRTEWSPDFERRMRNRLILGALRYGRLHGEGKPQYDRIAAIRARADLYARTGNLEHLVDIANLALLEYEEGDHPLRHWTAGDDTTHVSRR